MNISTMNHQQSKRLAAKAEAEEWFDVRHGAGVKPLSLSSEHTRQRYNPWESRFRNGSSLTVKKFLLRLRRVGACFGVCQNVLLSQDWNAMNNIARKHGLMTPHRNLTQRAKTDSEKVGRAARLRAEMTMTLWQIAQRLQMGTRNTSSAKLQERKGRNV